MSFACSNGNHFKDIPLSLGNHRQICILERQVWVFKLGCLKEFSRENNNESSLYLHVNTSITESPRCTVHRERDDTVLRGYFRRIQRPSQMNANFCFCGSLIVACR